MNKFVIDSNIFVKVFLDEKDSLSAMNFLENSIKEDIKLIVPSIFSYEIISIAQRNNIDPHKVNLYLDIQTNIDIINLSLEITDRALKIILF